MSTLDENFDPKLPVFSFRINYKEPILVRRFTKSLNAFNHLYSLIAQSEEPGQYYQERRSHELRIDSIKEGSIVSYLSEIDPMTIVNVVGAISSIISLFLSFGKKQETKITINNYYILNIDEICDDLESIVQLIRNSEESIEIHSEKGIVKIDFEQKQQIIESINNIKDIRNMKEE